MGAHPLACKTEMHPGTCLGSTLFWVLRKGDSGSSLYCCGSSWALSGHGLFAVVRRLGLCLNSAWASAFSPRPQFPIDKMKRLNPTAS